MTTSATPTSTTGSESSKTMAGRKRYDGPKDLIKLERQALTNALSGMSTMNYQAILQGFAAKGIAAENIKPRENVFTFHAWCGAGRVVRKGEHGVQICTYVPREVTDKATGEVKTLRMPRTATVFHIDQTGPLPAVQEARGRLRCIQAEMQKERK